MSPFGDTRPYVLTELGRQFVHYAMDEAIPRVEGRAGAEANSQGPQIFTPPHHRRTNNSSGRASAPAQFRRYADWVAAMPKLRADPISEADLVGFLDDCSDFGFEIRVHRELVRRGFASQHGGTYEDPTSGKPREFDIRAIRMFGTRVLHLAVECKNLRVNYPLLVSCVPRRSGETYQCVIQSHTHGRPQIVRLENSHSRYRIQAPVGKSCAQVGRAAGTGDITAGDSGFYQKWAQALSSAEELIRQALSRKRQRSGIVIRTLVFSVVVVPNGTLWQCDFDEAGRRSAGPFATDHVSYFVDRTYTFPATLSSQEYSMSHIEFVTIDGLVKFVESFAIPDAEDYFLSEGVAQEAVE